MKRRKRRGAICVLACIMMITLVGFFALAVDLGDIMWHRAQVQNAADAAALAGAGALFPHPETLETHVYEYPYIENPRDEARRFVRHNIVAQYGPPAPAIHDRPRLDIDLGNVILGRWNGPDLIPDEWFPNAVQVTVPVSDARLLFGFITKRHECQATAVARVKYPHLLPFTVYVDAWVGDQVKVFPGPWDGTDLPPGNFGTLHIGVDGGGTTELREQIADGVDCDDLSPFGGKIVPETIIPGDTGMSVGMEVAFVGGNADGREYPGIIGEARFLPLYDYVSGNGSNAEFRIIRFVAARVVSVDLKGDNKHVALEPVTSLNDLVVLQLVK